MFVFVCFEHIVPTSTALLTRSISVPHCTPCALTNEIGCLLMTPASVGESQHTNQSSYPICPPYDHDRQPRQKKRECFFISNIIIIKYTAQTD